VGLAYTLGLPAPQVVAAGPATTEAQLFGPGQARLGKPYGSPGSC